MNNITLGADGRANYAISILRASNQKGELKHQNEFAPGVKLLVSPELAISGEWQSKEAELLSMEAEISGEGGWVALHITLPFESTLPYGVCGVVARTKAPQDLVANVCLRSGKEEGFEDQFFEKQMYFTPDESTHLDVIDLHRSQFVPKSSPWRELIIFLPSKSFQP